MYKYTALVSLLLICPLWAGAQTVYVTDILRLGIHRAQDTSDRPFQNLVSGTQLEILERVPNYAHVRTSDGQDGWVKSAYLVDQKPAQLRVAELEAQVDHMTARLAESAAAQISSEHEAKKLTEQMSASTDSGDAIQETLARLKRENQSYEARLDSYRGALPLSWVGGALVLSMVLGFVVGLWSLDKFSRRRHGGFRIY